MQGNPSVTVVTLAKQLDISTTAVEKHTAKLKALGRFERVGGRKSGAWKVVQGHTPPPGA
jgi:ATP-dependent DNA helicase RecG